MTEIKYPIAYKDYNGTYCCLIKDSKIIEGNEIPQYKVLRIHEKENNDIYIQILDVTDIFYENTVKEVIDMRIPLIEFWDYANKKLLEISFLKSMLYPFLGYDSYNEV